MDRLDVERGRRLCELMEEMSISNIDLARLTGVSTPTVSMWRSGAEIKNRYLVKVANRLRTSTDYLLSGTKKPDPDEVQLLQGFRSLPIKTRKSILSLIETLIT